MGEKVARRAPAPTMAECSPRIWPESLRAPPQQNAREGGKTGGNWGVAGKCGGNKGKKEGNLRV